MVANPYPGINAHVNSMLQTPGTPEQLAMWHSFHSNHVTYITDALNQMRAGGLVALTMQSLQVHGVSAPHVESFLPLPRASWVYERTPQRKLGKVRAVVEILCPTNKRSGANYPAYQHNKDDALRRGAIVHEIDYLHEFPPTVLHYITKPMESFALVFDDLDVEMTVDLAAVYRQALEAGAWTDSIDYAQPPERFETYSVDDQAFIREIMQKASA